jgi:putative transposase
MVSRRTRLTARSRGPRDQVSGDVPDLPPENWTTGNGRIRPAKGADSMRKSRFSEPQIVHILRQAEVGEKTIGQLCRDHGISVNTFYRWRRRYGGMGIPELRRQRHLEQENARLKGTPG